MNLRSYDGNDNENVKKKNTNSALVSHFFAHFFAFTARLRSDFS